MPGRRFDALVPPDKVERPADPAVRRANLRRIFPLFRAYRGRLSVVCFLIVFSAALGVIPPFLLRDVLDTAIPEDDVQPADDPRGRDDRDPDRHRGDRRLPDAALEPGRPGA